MVLAPLYLARLLDKTFKISPFLFCPFGLATFLV